MNIEDICKAVHKAYCDERIRQGKEPYWTNGDYNKLDEATKDYDRATVQAVLKSIKYEALKASHDKLKEALQKNYEFTKYAGAVKKENTEEYLKEFFVLGEEAQKLAQQALNESEGEQPNEKS